MPAGRLPFRTPFRGPVAVVASLVDGACPRPSFGGATSFRRRAMPRPGRSRPRRAPGLPSAQLSAVAAPEEPPDGPTTASEGQETPRSDSRAPAREAPTVGERVAHIRDLMVGGEWVTGRTPFELAELWGVEPSTVRNYSAEASRQIRDAIGDADQIRTTVLLWTEQAAGIARAGRDARGLVAAAKQLADVAGVAAPQKIQVDGLADLLAKALNEGEPKP